MPRPPPTPSHRSDRGRRRPIINADHPDRYKRFIRSGDTSHTSLRGDLFYTGEADGVPLYEWTEDFVNSDPDWVDIVEDFVPAP